MSAIKFLGQRFLDKSIFESSSVLAGLELRGAYFFNTKNGRQLLKDGLSSCPLDTLKNVSMFIDGSFTLVYACLESNELWAVTDPYCLNKLYYRIQEGNVCISDDLEDFHSQATLDLNSSGLQEYLRFLDISPPATCFNGVRILDGGTILKISLESHRIEIFNCEISNAVAPTVNFEEAVEQTHELLRGALSNRLQGGGKIGLLLSGGVDSSLLAGMLAEMGYRNRPDKVVAYTVGFDDVELDESPIAEAVASHLEIAHNVLRFNIEEEYQALFDICSLLEVPFADPAVVPTYLSLQRMRADNVIGVMEGTGADGLIGANLPSFYRRLLKIDAFVPIALRGFIASVLEKIGDPGGYRPYFDFESIEEKFIRWKGWTRHEIEKLCSLPCDFSNTAFYRAFRESRIDGPNELYRKLLVNMPDYRITDTCRLMGFKPVFPFFDQNLRSFIEPLPMNYKCRQGENKVLYKELLSRMVPRELWDVPKHGFNYAFEKLLLHRNAELVNRYLSKQALGWHHLFDVDIVDKCREDFLSGDHSLKFKIWALVVFQIWYEKNVVVSQGKVVNEIVSGSKSDQES